MIAASLRDGKMRHGDMRYGEMRHGKHVENSEHDAHLFGNIENTH